MAPAQHNVRSAGLSNSAGDLASTVQATSIGIASAGGTSTPSLCALRQLAGATDPTRNRAHECLSDRRCTATCDATASWAVSAKARAAPRLERLIPAPLQGRTTPTSTPSRLRSPTLSHGSAAFHGAHVTRRRCPQTDSTDLAHARFDTSSRLETVMAYSRDVDVHAGRCVLR